MTTDQEKSHGRDLNWTLRAKQAPEHIGETSSGTSWIVEVSTTGSHDGKPFQATHLACFMQRTLKGTPVCAPLQKPCCHWCETAGAMATLRTAALNLLRLSGFQSIQAGMQAVLHDISALLAMARRQPSPEPIQHFESALAPCAAVNGAAIAECHALNKLNTC